MHRHKLGHGDLVPARRRKDRDAGLRVEAIRRHRLNEVEGVRSAVDLAAAAAVLGLGLTVRLAVGVTVVLAVGVWPCVREKTERKENWGSATGSGGGLGWVGVII